MSRRKTVRAIEAVTDEAKAPITLINQLAEYLPILVKAGPKGITKAQFSGGIHLGDIIMKLRRKGFTIVTHMEPNTGPYGGEHGRYRLMDKVTYRTIDPATISKKKTPLAATKGLSNSKSNSTVSKGLNNDRV